MTKKLLARIVLGAFYASGMYIAFQVAVMLCQFEIVDWLYVPLVIGIVAFLGNIAVGFFWALDNYK